MPETKEPQAGFLGESSLCDPEIAAARTLGTVDFTVEPVAQTVISALNYDGYGLVWDERQGDYFGARYTVYLQVENAGIYTFALTPDDGSRLSIDGLEVINNDGEHAATLQAVALDLDAGRHLIEVFYFDWGGRKTLDLKWSGPDTGDELVSLESVTTSDMLVDAVTETPDDEAESGGETKPVSASFRRLISRILPGTKLLAACPKPLTSS